MTLELAMILVALAVIVPCLRVLWGQVHDGYRRREWSRPSRLEDSGPRQPWKVPGTSHSDPRGARGARRNFRR